MSKLSGLWLVRDLSRWLFVEGLALLQPLLSMQTGTSPQFRCWCRCCVFFPLGGILDAELYLRLQNESPPYKVRDRWPAGLLHFSRGRHHKQTTQHNDNNTTFDTLSSIYNTMKFGLALFLAALSLQLRTSEAGDTVNVNMNTPSAERALEYGVDVVRCLHWRSAFPFLVSLCAFSCLSHINSNQCNATMKWLGCTFCLSSMSYWFFNNTTWGFRHGLLRVSHVFLPLDKSINLQKCNSPFPCIIQM